MSFLIVAIPLSSAQSSWLSNTAFSDFSSSISSVSFAILADSSLCFEAFQKEISFFSVSMVFRSFAAVLIFCTNARYSAKVGFAASRYWLSLYLPRLIWRSWYRNTIILARNVSIASAIAGKLFLTACAIFFICAFNSRNRALSALIWRFSSQRSETIHFFSSALAITPSWMVGCSSSPRSAWLRWSIRSSCPARSKWRLVTSAHALRQKTSCSSLFQRSEIGFCLPYLVLLGYLDTLS